MCIFLERKESSISSLFLNQHWKKLCLSIMRKENRWINKENLSKISTSPTSLIHKLRGRADKRLETSPTTWWQAPVTALVSNYPNLYRPLPPKRSETYTLQRNDALRAYDLASTPALRQLTDESMLLLPKLPKPTPYKNMRVEHRFRNSYHSSFHHQNCEILLSKKNECANCFLILIKISLPEHCLLHPPFFLPLLPSPYSPSSSGYDRIVQ